MATLFGRAVVMSVALLKLGGSLLDVPEMPARLRTVLMKLDGDQPLLICGGGPTADVVREWDAVHRLGEERSHWLALESIRLNQRLLLDLLPELELVANRSAAESAWRRDRVPLLDLLSFVSIEESVLSAKEQLPHRWDVTSDSLSAWVALRWPASRLVLLKSAELSHEGQEFVDAHFPTIARDLPPVCWCNLRRSGEMEFRPYVAVPNGERGASAP